MQAEIAALSPPEFIDWLFANVTNVELDFYRWGREWHGSAQNHRRLGIVAEYCALNYPGDLIEIGCLLGESTVILAEIAKKYNRRVIAVDPWHYEDGDAYYDPDVSDDNHYKQFCEATTGWRDLIDIIRLSSLDPRAIGEIKSRPLCFAYQDGLHTYEGVTTDLHTLAHCAGIIAVDDVIMYDVKPANNADTRRAFYESAVLLSRLPMTYYLSREWYLCPPRVGVERA